MAVEPVAGVNIPGRQCEPVCWCHSWNPVSARRADVFRMSASCSDDLVIGPSDLINYSVVGQMRQVRVIPGVVFYPHAEMHHSVQ